MKKIKIYIFHPYSKIGGADLSLSRLINNLNSKKYEICFICLEKPGIKKYLNKKIIIKKFNSTRSITTIFPLRKFILQNINQDQKNFKKIIFISNQNFANIISIISLFRIPNIKTILIERNNPIELDVLKNFKNKIIKFLMKHLYKSANLIIGISKELSKDLKKLCNTKVITIYNPSFDKNLYYLSKEKINIRIKKKIILNIGRFEKQKNHLMLLKSFKESLKIIDSHLLLIGYGSEIKSIKKFIIENNLKKNVSIINNPKNPYKFFKIANLFILTSLYEGFGNVLVEAGMFKIPIISTKCKSGPKEILNYGKYGDLVNINDEVGLTNLIVKNLKKVDRRKISLMFNSLNRFNIENHINHYEHVFKKI